MATLTQLNAAVLNRRNPSNWKVLTNSGGNVTALNSVTGENFSGTTAAYNAIFTDNSELYSEVYTRNQALVDPDGKPIGPIVLTQTAVPVGVAQSGTVTTAGTITFAIALPTAYFGIWLYFPANAITNNGGNPGFYWCTSVASSSVNFQVTNAYA